MQKRVVGHATIGEWLERENGEISYNLTQFFTSCQCLYRFKLDTSQNCLKYDGVPEAGEQIYPRSKIHLRKEILKENLCEMLSPKNVVWKMLVYQGDT